ncbi:uncharacterized protein Pyn_23945 [Prunus yedoensis var. nudiflora]|uniref:Uncharacterized protein n=1 Tax=Prunus yedoensis var. nudiflora TaxID=2094558 RepID=A0A314YS89_PRUYE|nr:uncharacterized protein Pyn_23945 [Prunus yedoensis var. nudiflora]
MAATTVINTWSLYFKHLWGSELENERPIKDALQEQEAMKSSPSREDPEVINAWELMEGLEEAMPISNSAKKSPKSRALLRGFADFDPGLRLNC